METLEFLVGHCGDQGGLSPLLWRQTPFMAFVANLEKSHSEEIVLHQIRLGGSDRADRGPGFCDQ